MRFDEKQIVPPKSWVRFEELCLSLFREIWADPLAQREGRLGQPQHGVDVWGNPGSDPTRTHGVQCKGKENYPTKGVNPTEFDTELAKADSFEPLLNHWTLVSTARTDARLQTHVRKVSIARHSAGKFPVRVLGWDDLLHLIAEHPKLIEQYYPDDGSRLEELFRAVREQPSRTEWQSLKDDISALRRGATEQLDPENKSQWLDLPLGISRGLGPALTGRPLGPADAAACPRLPEADALLAELKRSHSVRLVGVAGAGKSVCALQAAQDLATKGFRVVKLLDPSTAPITLVGGQQDVLHIVDDAHLAHDVALGLAEQSANSEQLLLSIHTSARDSVPGSVHLDAARAVRVISEGFKARWDETLAEVARVDDWIGKKMLDERLEDRFVAADAAEFPWQFCFILGGGWRRVGTIASSCRAVGFDIALAGIALLQIASRDAVASLDEITELFAAASIDQSKVSSAIDWLAQQRFINGTMDIRCPHQRFAAKILGPILDGQSPEGRKAIARIAANLFVNSAMPLSGLSSLLLEWRLGNAPRAIHLLGRAALDPVLERCWAAETPEDRRAACNILGEMEVYDETFYATFSKTQVERIAAWFTDPVQGAAYSVGRFINGTWRCRRLGRRIIRVSDPSHIAAKLNAAESPFASEIAWMVQSTSALLPKDWKATYLGAIDRDHARQIVSNWPQENSLYALADYCAHFAMFDEDFGFELIRLATPRFQQQLSDEPVQAFANLEDLFRSALRVDDPLGIYRGRLAPTSRMKEAARQIVAVWEGPSLARSLSSAPVRDYQRAAQILQLLRKFDRPRFEATVDAMSWKNVDETIGPLWARPPHEVQVLLGSCHARRGAQAPMARLIESRLEDMEALPPRLALMAPNAAVFAARTGKRIAIAEHGHVAWDFGAGVLAQLHEHDATLPPLVLRAQLAEIALPLSQGHSSWYNEALPFLRVFHHVDAEGFDSMLGLVDVANARKGWAAALETKSKSKKRNGRRHYGSRDTAAWLIERSLARNDPIGMLARDLRAQFGENSKPSDELMSPID